MFPLGAFEVVGMFDSGEPFDDPLSSFGSYASRQAAEAALALAATDSRVWDLQIIEHGAVIE